MAVLTQGANVQLVMDLTPAGRIDKTSLAGYWLVGTPNSPDLLPSQTGWQLYRMDSTTFDVDYARGGDGKATDDFVFTYDERATKTYGAAGL